MGSLRLESNPELEQGDKPILLRISRACLDLLVGILSNRYPCMPSYQLPDRGKTLAVHGLGQFITMCDHHNTFLVFLVIVCCNGSIVNEHNGPNVVSSIPVAVETHPDNLLDDRYLRTRSGFINFIIDKGCSYVSGYVRMKYVQDRRVNRAIHNGSSDHIDWERNVINAGQHFHVPSELIKALITCGQNYSMAALFPNDPSKPHDQFQLVGKRHFNDSDNEGRHPDNDYYEDEFDGNHSSNNTIWDSFMNRTTNEEFSKHVEIMCTSFCRYVNRRYHLKDIPFRRFSMSWLLDVYKMVMISHVRIEYIHGLVGCGMEYALTALNAPNWLTRFYNFALAMEMHASNQLNVTLTHLGK